MERLISLFKRPQDFEPLETSRREQLLSAELKGLDGEPEYFVQLMDYLRQRNRAGSAAREAAWPAPKLLNLEESES